MSFPDIYRAVTGHDENGKAMMLGNGSIQRIRKMCRILFILIGGQYDNHLAEVLA